MAKRQRSPLGDLVYTYRKKLHLTQSALATRASHPDNPEYDHGTVSVRTVWEIEQELSTGASRQRARRPSTIRALAEALGLTPGTPAHDEFLDAARDARGSSLDDTAPSFPEPDIPLFVPDGREAHLQRLDTAIDQAVREHAGVLFVGAEPGGGKTSLIAHVCRQALDRHERLVVLWGDCTGRSGATDPWQPFRQAMGTLVGDTAAAGAHQLLSRKNAGRIAFRAPLGIRSVVDDAPGLIDRVVSAESLRVQARSGRLETETARRLDRALDAAASRPPVPLDLNELLFRVLRRYAASGTVILVLDDLHWADTGTADMLSHLMGRLQHQRLPILVIGTWRPVDLESASTGGRPAMRQLLIKAPRLFNEPALDLSNTVGGAAGQAFVNAVVDLILPGTPGAFRETLFEQTAGLPLFVLTMLRWYLADGDLTRDPDPAQLPSEIEALFAGLIDRLPPELPPLLDAASVQGASFSADVVMRVTGLSRPVLMERLDTQSTHRFKALYPGGVTSIAGQRGHEYHFSHALFRDFLYHRLSPIRRTDYHAATAGAMLALYGAGEHDGAGRIAFHFDQAGERRQAAAAYVKAGIHALGRQDHDLARIHFDRVGKLGLREEDPYVVTQSLIGLGNSAYGQGDNERATRFFERAHDLARRENVLSLIANCLIGMGWLDYNAGRMLVGADRLREAIEVLTGLDDAHELCRAHVLHSHLLYGIGHYDEAAAAARRGITVATDLKDDMIVVAGKTALANCWIDIGHYKEAITGNEEATAICEDHGNVHRASLCRVNLALAELERGRWDEASAALAIVFDPALNATSRLIGLAAFNAGLVAEGREDLAEAYRHFAQSLEIRRAHGQHASVLDSLAGLLRVATAERGHTNMHTLIADLGPIAPCPAKTGGGEGDSTGLTLPSGKQLARPGCVRTCGGRYKTGHYD